MMHLYFLYKIEQLCGLRQWGDVPKVLKVRRSVARVVVAPYDTHRLGGHRIQHIDIDRDI